MGPLFPTVIFDACVVLFDDVFQSRHFWNTGGICAGMEAKICKKNTRILCGNQGKKKLGATLNLWSGLEHNISSTVHFCSKYDDILNQKEVQVTLSTLKRVPLPPPPVYPSGLRGQMQSKT